MRMEIKRLQDDGVQTLGELRLYDREGKQIFYCKTLELSYKNNQRRISCIPKGNYQVLKRYSPKYGRHFHILNVRGRDWILIHQGNFHFQILGCVLVGRDHIDINGDGRKDVTFSKLTMQKLNELIRVERFDLQIV